MLNYIGKFIIDLTIYLEKTSTNSVMWNSSKNFNIKEKCENSRIFRLYSRARDQRKNLQLDVKRPMWKSCAFCHILAIAHATNFNGNFRIDTAIYLEKTVQKTLMWNSSKNFNIKEKFANLGIFHLYS
jgi:hypothetical protein